MQPKRSGNAGQYFIVFHFPYADPRFLRIWPSEQQAFVRWPPNVAISVSDFAGVAGPGTRVSSGAEPPMQNGPGVASQAI
jgi:hypothetical protein